MFNNDQGCGSDAGILDADLLITTTNTSSNINTCSSRKYASLWRRTIIVTVLISLNKTNSPEQDLSHSPTSSSPLITHQTNSNSFQQEDPNIHNSGHEIGFKRLVLKAGNRSYRRCFKNQDGSASTSSYALNIQSDSVEEEISGQQKLVDGVVQIIKERNLNSLKAFGGVQEVASVFGSDLRKGKDNQESEAWDPNNVITAKGFLYFLLEAGLRLTNLLLLVSAALSFATGIMKQGATSGWHDVLEIS